MQFVLSPSHKPYKQNSEHCYAHSLLVSSNIFMSLPLCVSCGVLFCCGAFACVIFFFFFVSGFF